MNKLILCGNLTRDPIVKNAGPKVVAAFSLAINEGENLTTYVDCEAWENTASVVNEYVKKGHKLLVEGRLKIDNVDGKKYPKCVVSRVELIQPKSR